MSISRRGFLRAGSLMACGASFPSFPGAKIYAQTGAPAGSPDAYAVPKPVPPGPFSPTWESLRDGYRVPGWFNEAKFGIFIHWGLYSIPGQDQ